MKRTSAYLILFILSLANSICVSQANKTANAPALKKKEIRPLSVGDEVPGVMLKMLSYPTKTAKLADFKGKFVILDFWSTYCLGCIREFPKLESIQRELGNKLQFILVTAQNDSTINNFLEKRTRATNSPIQLPIIVGDTVLNALFKHTTLPHYVWIDDKGIVKSITGSDQITKENVLNVANHVDVNMKQKTDKDLDYHVNLPLYIGNNGGSGEQFLYHSILTKYIDGIHPLLLTKCNKNTDEYFIKAMNVDIRMLHQIAFDSAAFYNTGQSWIPVNQTILKTKDTTQFVGNVNGTVQNDNLYSYELVCPKTTPQGLQQVMKDDLKKYFGLKVTLKKRKTPCLVLTAKDTATISTKGEKPVYEINQFNISLRNIPFSILTRYLKYSLLSSLPYPFIDETGIKGKVDININVKIYDWKDLSTALQKKYRMDLKLEEREVDFLTIEDRD